MRGLRVLIAALFIVTLSASSLLANTVEGIYFTLRGGNGNGVYKTDLSGAGATLLTAQNSTWASGIKVDEVHGKMYWANFGSPDLGIWQANLDGSGAHIIATSPNPDCVALDIPGGKLYWSDVTAGAVYQANLDGGGQVQVASLGSMLGVAVDHAAGKLFYSNSVEIFTTGLNGGASSPIAAIQGTFWLDGLNANTKKLYSTSGVENIIRSLNYDGSNVQTVLTGGQQYTLGLAVDEEYGFLYYSTYSDITGSSGIYRSDLNGGSITQLAAVAGVVWDLDVIGGTPEVAIPEPLTMAGVALGISACGAYIRRRRQVAKA